MAFFFVVDVFDFELIFRGIFFFRVAVINDYRFSQYGVVQCE